MTYYVAVIFTDDTGDKEIHYDAHENYDVARKYVRNMAADVLPYYMLTGNLYGMLDYTRRVKHATGHISQEKFDSKPDTLISVDAMDCIVPNKIILSNYLPDNLDENGVHPETGYKYIKHDSYDATGELIKNGEATSN